MMNGLPTIGISVLINGMMLSDVAETQSVPLSANVIQLIRFRWMGASSDLLSFKSNVLLFKF